MRRTLGTYGLAAGLLIHLATAAVAQTTPGGTPTVAASERFAAGSRAFEAGDYALALSEFEAAIRAGSDGPAVHHNVAVCHYRLGDYARAEAAFRDLGRRFPAMRALADYNLGLALTRAARHREARAAFERALRADDERIAALAAAMLARLPGDTTAPARAAWTRLVDFRIGHDDNVALLDASSLPAGSSTDSPFSELLAYAGGPVTDSGRWYLDASAYLVDYPDADGFDQSGLYLGARYDRAIGSWRIVATPRLSRTSLDGDAFEQHAGIAVDLRRALRSVGAVASIELAHDEVDDVEPQFAYVDGDRDQLTIRVDKPLGAGQLRVDYRHEDNDRAGAGVSAERDRFALRYRRPLRPAWIGELTYEYRVSEYARLATPREERRHQAGFEASRPFASGWRLTVQYRYADNDSSDPFFSYERHRFAVGAAWAF